MENLPVELLESICRFLPLSDLASFSRCGKLFNNLITPLLYRNLNIGMRSGNPDRKTSSILQTLVRNSSVRQFIQAINVTNENSTFWTAGHSAFLGIILAQALDSSVQAKSFSWTTSCIFTERVFPGLINLRCTKIHSYKELEWIRWHLANCESLRHLHLAFVAPFARLDIEHVFRNAQLHLIRTLRLELVDLSIFANPMLDSVYALELNSCSGTRSFLDRLAQSRQKIRLKSLRITANLQLTTIYQFLSNLDPSSKLEELSLRIGGVSEYLDMRKIHYPSLRTLVLDFRKRFNEPRSAVMYCINDLQDIVKSFPSLEYLGLPLNIRDASFAKYRRKDYTVSRWSGILFEDRLTARCRRI